MILYESTVLPVRKQHQNQERRGISPGLYGYCEKCGQGAGCCGGKISGAFAGGHAVRPFPAAGLYAPHPDLSDESGKCVLLPGEGLFEGAQAGYSGVSLSDREKQGISAAAWHCAEAGAQVSQDAEKNLSKRGKI